MDTLLGSSLQHTESVTHPWGPQQTAGGTADSDWGAKSKRGGAREPPTPEKMTPNHRCLLCNGNKLLCRTGWQRRAANSLCFPRVFPAGRLCKEPLRALPVPRSQLSRNAETELVHEETRILKHIVALPRGQNPPPLPAPQTKKDWKQSDAHHWGKGCYVTV